MKILEIRREILDTSVTKMTCPFGGTKNHKGIDVVPKSTAETPAVLAYDRGTVIATGNIATVNDSNGTAGMGTYVAIKHDDGLITRYQHLKYNSLKVKKGDRVTRGQKIGVYGRPTTGNSTGCHLHFDISAKVKLGGKTIAGTFCGETRYYYDPVPYLELKCATVVSDVNIRAGAGLQYKVIGEKKAGTGVTIYGKSDRWLRISPTKSEWIHENYAREW